MTNVYKAPPKHFGPPTITNKYFITRKLENGKILIAGRLIFQGQKASKQLKI